MILSFCAGFDARKNKATAFTNAEAIVGQCGFARYPSQLPLLLYGNAGHRRSLWELSFGQSYRVTPNVIFGKAPEVASTWPA
jgi:hypothetical protein